MGRVVRAYEGNAPLYCNMTCTGLARRTVITKAKKVANKRLYDMEYRVKNRERLKLEKAAHYKATADREKEREYRKKNMRRHVEYCRQPVYKAKKAKYDKKHRYEKLYGKFAEAAAVLHQLEVEIRQRVDKYEIYSLNGTLNKKLKRRREYEREKRKSNCH